jgi:hypothetical protein
VERQRTPEESLLQLLESGSNPVFYQSLRRTPETTTDFTRTLPLTEFISGSL